MYNKSRLKSLIFGYETRVSALIANALVFSTPKYIVFKEARKELEQLGSMINLSSKELGTLWTSFTNRWYKLSTKTRIGLKRAENYKETLFLRQDVVFGEMKNDFLLAEREKNFISNQIEAKDKEAYLDDLLSDGIFYLCSAHINPAHDHADWEGKVYVCEDWESRARRSDVKRIRAYIKNHDVKTVEWVTGPDVWLIRRPNCKHYFIRVTVDEVLGSSVKKLLRDHKMYMKDTVQMSYEDRNAKFYYERGKFWNEMRKMAPSREIIKAVRNDRKLHQEWVSRARNNKK